MRDPRIQLRSPWLAGFLGWLIPGAGHLYQGRIFKAAIYFVCIIGLFLTGMAMAEWKAVQPPPKFGPNRTKIKMLKYASQAAVGIPALYGLIQRERHARPVNRIVDELDAPLTAPFIGNAQFHNESGVQEGPITGTLTLEPTVLQFGGRSITGRFEGEFQGKHVTLKLSNSVELAKPIEANDRRFVLAGIVNEQNGRLVQVGHLTGTIPRSFWDWFQVPADDNEEQELHRRLGKAHEVAMVFTWIAGLLNILAIWDAVEGPAYGYSDDEQKPADSPTESVS